jgi:hypothetical protein
VISRWKRENRDDERSDHLTTSGTDPYVEKEIAMITDWPFER